MRAFTQTELFGELLVPMDDEVSLLQKAVRAQAHQLDDRQLSNQDLPRSKRRPTKALENSISRLQGQLNEVQEKKRGYLSGDTRYLRHLSLGTLLTLLGASLDDEPKRGGVFTSEERRQEQLTVSYEGKREREIRERLGLDPTPTVECNDTPHGEIKYGGSAVEPFRTYQTGRKHWGLAFRKIIRTWSEESLQPEVWDAMFDGEVSAGKVYGEFPIDLRVLIQETMAPGRVLATYDRGIFYATDAAYVHVPVGDYPRAFSLVCITQMGPKYRIRREYVESRLEATMKGTPDEVSIDVVGQTRKEARPVAAFETGSHRSPTDVDCGRTKDRAPDELPACDEVPTVTLKSDIREVGVQVDRVRVDDVNVGRLNLSQFVPDVLDGGPGAVGHDDVPRKRPCDRLSP